MMKSYNNKHRKIIIFNTINQSLKVFDFNKYLIININNLN